MPLANNTLVLVTDGRKTLFFRNEGDVNQIDLRTESHDEREDAKDSEMKTDAPGAIGQSAGYSGRVAYEETDFHQLEEDRFAADTAEMLKMRALRNEFRELIVVAPPRALGELRKHFHKVVESRIIGEIAKDFANRPTDEIEQLIGGSETRGSA